MKPFTAKAEVASGWSTCSTPPAVVKLTEAPPSAPALASSRVSAARLTVAPGWKVSAPESCSTPGLEKATPLAAVKVSEDARSSVPPPASEREVTGPSIAPVRLATPPAGSNNSATGPLTAEGSKLAMLWTVTA